MQTPATPDNQQLPADADSADETQPDSSWSLDRLGEFATEEVNNSFFAENAAILQATKSAAYLFRAGHALFLAREKCKGEKHGDWTRFKKQYSFADTSVNDAIRLYENAKTEDALAGLGITEAKKKFVYPPKAVTSTANSVKKTGKKAAKTSSQQPTTAVTQATNSPPNHHAQSNGTTAKHRPTSPDPAPSGDDESEPASAPEEPEVSFTTALIEELEEIAQRLGEIAQDDFGKAVWTKEEAQQGSNAVNSMYPTLKTIQRRITNEEYR